ncbi:DUF1127 domain-containing protein [Hoeflea sp. TYP-13]|uniref:DUF1127 domain-containing protein n=1 Tax=Hoeflea sp. TYP-13 TaxID=3230023 RepID=UPI0034C5D44D
MSYTAGSRAALRLHARPSIFPVRWIAARISAYWKCRCDVAHVRELPDYLLKDIGVAHGDIETAFQSGSRGINIGRLSSQE